MSQIGRISGPLLFSNLERNGVDLAFRNNLGTTELLFLDVNNNRIGVNTDSPSSALQLPNTLKTVNLITGNLTLPEYVLSNSEISKLLGDIHLEAGETVRFGGLSNDTILIKDNTILAEASNSAIDLTPSGTGKTVFQSSAEVFGNLSTPKNITLDGTINFGNESSDTIDFNSELDSDLIPDETNTYSLGTPTQRWRNTFTRLLNGESVSTSGLVSGQIDFDLRQGNTFYVSVNGSDDSFGDHIQAPFRTIRRALEAADASTTGPVSIQVFPGEYQEQFPLEVPNFVSVIGTDLRGVNVVPDSASEFEDVFLLDGDTTIENITIKNFYFQSGKGYAFRFRPGAIIQNRSPYIKNVTVITKGTEFSASDPRGFESGDAGQGALIDGAALDSISDEASMLFHSCTFITPGVDCVTMTNGVRVEWLSSFVYFANRGLYAVNGSTGRTTNDGSTVKFGAEVRSISSANIYGNFGAVADGNDCLMYLIKHNFAYIGSGKRVDNDKTTSIQSQEVAELNNGDIYYTSVNHLGTYRVGDSFFADFENGTTSISDANLTGDELTNLRIENNGDETFVSFNNYFTGNIEVNDNLIESFVGDINIDSPLPISLNSNTSIGKDLSITGDLSFDGNLSLFGNETSDTVDFNTPIDQDFKPNADLEFDLGSTTKRWHTALLDEVAGTSISISNNTVSTLDSNSNLELRAQGTGTIRLKADAVVVSENFAANSTVSLKDLDIIGNTVVDGDFDQTGDRTLSGFLSTADNLSVAKHATFENISIEDNTVRATESNSDLELSALGTGTVRFPSSSVQIANNLSASEIASSDISVNNNIDSAELQVNNILIRDNFVTTTESNSSLELSANSTGAVLVDSVAFESNRVGTRTGDFVLASDVGFIINSTGALQLPVGGTAQIVLEPIETLDGGSSDDNSLNEPTIDGGFSDTIYSSQDDVFNGDTSIVEPTGGVGDIRFNSDVNLFEGFRNATVSFGGLYSDDRQTSMLADPTEDFVTFTVNENVMGTVNSSGAEFVSLETDDILVNSNTVSTAVSDADLELRRNGSGEVRIDNISVSDNRIKNLTNNGSLSFAVTGLGYQKIAGTNGVVVPVGTTPQRPDTPETGETRWNTTDEILEVWDGSVFVDAAGTSAFITQEIFDDIITEYTLMFG
jgi:cytoskeletal protein CcmA (bactofilin family)